MARVLRGLEMLAVRAYIYDRCGIGFKLCWRVWLTVGFTRKRACLGLHLAGHRHPDKLYEVAHCEWVFLFFEFLIFWRTLPKIQPVLLK